MAECMQTVYETLAVTFMEQLGVLSGIVALTPVARLIYQAVFCGNTIGIVRLCAEIY